PRQIAVNYDIVALAIRRIETVDRMGREQLHLHDLVQQFPRVGEQFSRRGTSNRIVKQIRVAPAHLPSVEEGGPVNVRNQLLKRKIGKHFAAGKFGNGNMRWIPGNLKLSLSRLSVRKQRGS